MFEEVENKGKKAIGAAIRGVVQVGAGVLIARGLPQELINPAADALGGAATGAVVFGLSYLWSLIQKRALPFLK